MVDRSLPERRNPHTSLDASPPHDELLERRRLGRTKLSVKAGLVGTTNATQKENLGPVEYAHLRAPLPDDLATSEIFAPQPGQPHPQSYFFMRRSKDGFVSATGMFKIAFPWALHSEEQDERDYLKALEGTSADDVAGNIWVTPTSALDLAADYGIKHWIRALLDPLDIQSSPTSSRKNIAEPPKFELPSDIPDIKLSPPSTSSKRGRGARASSPAKAASTRVKASPRKRQTKKERETYNHMVTAPLDDSASITEATPVPESVTNDTEDAEQEVAETVDLNGEGAEPAPEPLADESSMVRVEVDQEVEINGDTEITHTNVVVEMPASLPDMPLPEDTEAMLRQAREMVEKAKELEGSPKQPRQKRRIEDADGTDFDLEMPLQPAKRAKVLEEKYKRERVRTRAVFGVAASLAVAAVIPFIQTFF